MDSNHDHPSIGNELAPALQRASDAMRLATGGSLDLTNVAVDTGYSSTSAFIAAFKKAFGITPSRYASPPA